MSPKILRRIRKSGLQTNESWLRYGLILNPNSSDDSKRAGWAVMVKSKEIMEAVYCPIVQKELQAAAIRSPNSFESPEYHFIVDELYCLFNLPV